MVGTRSSTPMTKKTKPSMPGSGGRAITSNKRKVSVLEMQIQGTSSQDKSQKRVEDVHVALEEPEPETRASIVLGGGGGGEDVETGNGNVSDEGDMDQLVSDEVVGYSEDDGPDELEFENTEGSITEKKMIHFNDKGQPVGEQSAPFTSYLGSIMRKHCSITYEKWRDVPSRLREKLWQLVTDKYVVPVAYKLKVIERIHAYWRHHKSVLRLTHYDKYNTDEERKRNCPKGVRQDIWNIFVDNQSSPAAQARRKAGKHARQAMKTPHYTGRTGAARTEEALKKGNPLATVTRTDLYLAVHSPKGSCPTAELTEKVKRIKAIAQQNPSSINLDVDHDPVAQVCGPERTGRPIRGMGMGVSKSSLRYTAPVLDLLQKERRLRVQAEEQIAGLREQRRAPRADHDGQEMRSPVIAEEQNATSREHAVFQQQACRVDKLGQERRRSFSAGEQIVDVSEQVVYQRGAPRVGQLEKESRLSVLPEEQTADRIEQVVSQVPSPRGGQPKEEGSCHRSADEQIETLKKQVVSQKEQIEQLLEEKEQIADLKKLIISQGLMIADMRELITRLCS